MNTTPWLMKLVTGFVAVVSAVMFASGWFYATWMTFFGALMLFVSGLLYTAIAAADQPGELLGSDRGLLQDRDVAISRMPVTEDQARVA